jgi:hypothetical protein
MPWICPRCQTVHSDMSYVCSCPPPTYTSSGVTLVPPDSSAVTVLPQWAIELRKDVAELQRAMAQYMMAKDGMTDGKSQDR